MAVSPLSLCLPLSLSLSLSLPLLPSLPLSLSLYPCSTRAEDLHKCTGVQAAALASEGSVEFAEWPKTLTKKEAVETVKKIWERNEKKEFNEAMNALHRTNGNKADRSLTASTQGCGDTDGVKCNSSSAGGNNSSSGSISSSNVCTATPGDCTAPSAEESANIVGTADPKTSSSSPINNDVSGGITAEHLEEIDTKWGPAVAALDPHRDVLLFPCERAECASVFPWGTQGRSAEVSSGTAVSAGAPVGCVEGEGKGESEGQHRWRLVVLEASWQHGKTMHRQVRCSRDAIMLC